jgi:hypothetical protein
MKPPLNRLYSDYLMPSRLRGYEALVCAARLAGYTQTSVRLFFEGLREGPRGDEKFLVQRHDIDTDPRTARKMFEIEKKHDVKASYYFRLSTLDYGLMREIEEYGSEASYHYEELATFAKKNRIRDPADVRQRLPEIRDHFAANFGRIEQRTGTKMTTVASHGDFANRRLKLNNTEILNDQQLRERCGIECETYDRSLLDHIDLYITDRPRPQCFFPTSPVEALGRHRRILLLTHPRHWETNWQDNTRENLVRLYEGLAW